jgi:hypothetical protein
MLSLNDTSIIAVFRLPMTLDDINAFGPGLTFATLLNKAVVPDVLNSQQVKTYPGLRGLPSSPKAGTSAKPTMGGFNSEKRLQETNDTPSTLIPNEVATPNLQSARGTIK